MSYRRKLALSLVVVSLAGAATGAATHSAFVATTSSPANSFSTGTVAIGDDDAGGALLTLAGATPGDSASGCILVTYDGSLDAGVRLSAETSGSLAGHLDVIVTRGTGAGAFPSCASFSADPIDYIGAGDGVVYSGTLAAFPSAASAEPEPTAASAETWSTGEQRVYRISITLPEDVPPAAQGLSGSATFTWTAENL